MKWFIKALKQYADFKTRARRKEYWMFILFSFIISVICSLIDISLGIAGQIVGVSLIYGILILIPSISVAVRRLHDIGKSGWMLLIGLIPIIGSIWLGILFCKDSQSGENQWGANPKDA